MNTRRSDFFTDPGMNSMARAMLGRVHTGAADAGEALATFDRVTDGDAASWAREWEATADRVAAIGADCLRRGHPVSGRDALLRAATYYTACVVTADGCAEPETVRARTFAAHRRCWERYLGLLADPPERLDVPYEGTTMPGWFFAAPGDGPKPTLVAVNGADGALSFLWPGHGSQAAVRGYNVLLFDGPGQQRMLFERGIPFRPDWEHVVRPVVDEALRRPDVDPGRLVLYAVSQGGYWGPRALAFEHRFAAAVIDGGVVDVSAAWGALLSPELKAMLDNGERDKFNAAIDLVPADLKRVIAWRAKPYGCPTVYDTYREVERYRITPELAARITTPMLIADPDDERYFTGQPERLYEMVRGEKALVRFTEAEGAAGHCEPMARALAAQRFFDFLDGHVGLTGS
ncbi:alpha/beta hydrolase family protein [Actinomadura chibensis]|uniref:Dipeptidyl aminopeptidase n=1 Tax=Actinomadura chibensis TaxID=392828 RepID=A0A5D0NXP5_9ACTN|nr:dipeptidyl aminopeptidase [Actinomadura chibensis]TYB48944.1 dipeptidyl aminopeptidase [Actinomadura chibensis]